MGELWEANLIVLKRFPLVIQVTYTKRCLYSCTCLALVCRFMELLLPLLPAQSCSQVELSVISQSSMKRSVGFPILSILSVKIHYWAFYLKKSIKIEGSYWFYSESMKTKPVIIKGWYSSIVLDLWIGDHGLWEWHGSCSLVTENKVNNPEKGFVFQEFGLNRSFNGRIFRSKPTKMGQEFMSPS